MVQRWPDHLNASIRHVRGVVSRSDLEVEQLGGRQVLASEPQAGSVAIRPVVGQTTRRLASTTSTILPDGLDRRLQRN